MAVDIVSAFITTLLIASYITASPECLTEDHILNCSGKTMTTFENVKLQNFRIIDLSYNSIRQIQKLELTDNVESLNISHNHIIKVIAGAFDDINESLLSLDSLDLSYNLLREEGLQNLTKNLSVLEQLYLSGNIFHRLTSDLFNHGLMDIENILDLSNCSMQTISDDTFGSMSSLQTLNISHNNLTNLTNGIFRGLEELKILDLSNNRIAHLEGRVFIHLDTNVEVLDLSFNQIVHINQTLFEGLIELKNLSLEGNRLTKFPHEILVISNLMSLVSFDVGRNPIESISPSKVNTTSRLRVLYIHHMPPRFTNIEENSLSNYEELKEIHITDNYRLFQLNNIMGAGRQKFLEAVYLNNNSLVGISKSVFPWEKLKVVELSGNAWSCDCTIAWMKNVTNYYSEPISVRCEHPRNLHDKMLKDVPDNNLLCGIKTKTTVWYRDPPKAIFLGTLVGVLLLLTVIVTILLVKYKERLPCSKKVHGKYVMVYSQDADEAYLKVVPPNAETPLTESVDV